LNDVDRCCTLPGVLLFKRILDFKQAALGRLRNKRKADRYPVGPRFPLKGTISLRGGASTACDWSGSPANLSSRGASLLLPTAAATARGERTTLRLAIDQYVLQLPCAVAHFRVLSTHAVCGLTLEPSGFTEQKAFFQLLEAVRIGAAMVPVKAPAFTRCPPGLALEQYRADAKSRLTVWRAIAGRGIDSFELVIDKHCLRGEAAGQTLDVYAQPAGKAGNTAPSDRASAGVTDEVRQLFRWVVPNFTNTVPADVQLFMRESISGTPKPAVRGGALRTAPAVASFPPPQSKRPGTRPPLSLK
jgi:hypothetical protein